MQHEQELGFLPRSRKAECKCQVLCSLEVKKKGLQVKKFFARCSVWSVTSQRKTRTCCLSKIMLQCGCSLTVYAKCIPGFPSWKWKPWNITYTIRHESTITTCQIEISSWKSVWKFNLFPSTRLMETHLICILFFFPLHFKNSFQIPFLSHSGCLTFFLQLLHVLMHRYNRAALRGCESLPKPCVGGPFLSELHSPAAFNIHHFFSLI